MARLPLVKRQRLVLLFQMLKLQFELIAMLCGLLSVLLKRQRSSSASIWDAPSRALHSYNIVSRSDTPCKDQLRMDRHTFHKLCALLRSVSNLRDNRNSTVEERTAIFLFILADHNKNRFTLHQFMRSGETVSRYFNEVLDGVIMLGNIFLKKPVAVTEESTNSRWSCFKDCLGALDGTHVRLSVRDVDKPRYRTRKNELATNVLGVCSHDMQFIYIQPGWEGSTADSRVLRDAVSWPRGLKVPKGYYYLVDAGYPNGKGFLAPYRGQRYHLNDRRGGNNPTTKEELFNMKHSIARNVIERCFGLLKLRWGIDEILKASPSYYPVKTQSRIIMACALLHNLIRQEMSIDPFESRLDSHAHEWIEPKGEVIEYVDSSEEAQGLRQTITDNMWAEWQQHHH